MLSVTSFVATQMACVVPPHLELQQDGEQNHHPVVNIGQTSPSPGDHDTFSNVPLELNVLASDPDQDPLFSRVFLDADYSRVIFAGKGNSDTSGGAGLQSMKHVFEVGNLCGGLIKPGATVHVLEVYVADRKFIAAGDFQIEDMRQTVQAVGKRDHVTWRLRCSQ